MATIKIIDSGLEKYSLKCDTNVLGRMYDNNAEAVDIIIPETETESACYANVVSCDGEVIDRIKIENNSLPISSNLTQYCEIYIGFSFIRPDDTEKQSEQLKFGFLYAIKPKDFTPEQSDTEKALAKLIASGFVKLIQDGDTVKFYNWQDIVVGTIYHEGINGFEIVDELPTENIDTHTIYLVKETVGESDDYYNEYIYINGEWELLGSTRIDLSNYYTKEQVDKIIETLTGVFNEKVDIINGNIDKKFDKTGGTVTGDMVVGGNFTVQGKTTTVDSETLRVTDKLIEVGKDNTAPLTSPAGLITPKYDGTNNGGIVYDHTGTAYVGDISLDSNGNVDVNNSDLQPIATRNATITNGNLVKWDSGNLKLVDAGKNVENLVDKLPASLRSQAYVRNSNGEDSGLEYTYTDEGNSLALRNESGQVQVSTPLQDNDAANKKFVEDNLNSILYHVQRDTQYSTTLLTAKNIGKYYTFTTSVLTTSDYWVDPDNITVNAGIVVKILPIEDSHGAGIKPFFKIVGIDNRELYLTNGQGKCSIVKRAYGSDTTPKAIGYYSNVFSVDTDSQFGGQAKSKYSTLFGVNVRADSNAEGSIVGGRYCIIDSPYTFAYGRSITTQASQETITKVVLGYNNKFNTKAIIEIGNGTDSIKSNAFEVLKDGRAKVQSAPVDTDDVVRKLELDNVNARYVSTSILGG